MTTKPTHVRKDPRVPRGHPVDLMQSVDVLQMIVRALMEERDEEKFVVETASLRGVEKYYDLTIEHNDAMMLHSHSIVVTLKEKRRGEVLDPPWVFSDTVTTSLHTLRHTEHYAAMTAEVPVDAPPPATTTPPSREYSVLTTECTGCAGWGEVLYDANKATWSQCPVCDGSGDVKDAEGEDDQSKGA